METVFDAVLILYAVKIISNFYRKSMDIQNELWWAVYMWFQIP